MSKAYFIELAEYNIWANAIAHSWLEQISDEQWERPIVSSFNGIHDTVLHVAGAEKIWLDRLNNIKEPVPLVTVFKGSKEELLDIWTLSAQGLKTFVENFEEKDLHGELTYKRINGQVFTNKYSHLFSHIFNHSTYHRGQLVTMLRQVGSTNTSSTDMIGFFFNK